MIQRRGLIAVSCSWAFLVAAACGGNPELVGTQDDGDGVGARGGRPNGGTGGVPGVGLPMGGDAGEGTTGGSTSPSGCDAVTCGAGQRCELEGDQGTCVDNTCADLDCDELSECQPALESGFLCRSIACDSDVECPPERHCDGEKCVDDVCEPESRQCDGDVLLACTSSGSGEESPYTCQSAGYFESSCGAADPNAVGCSCEGDWDCPEFTVCEVGLCKGTGVAPTCTLPPTSFEDVLPELEFRWGGLDEDNSEATGKAFPWSAQVASTPMVVNLDDDNGDGFVNELDFPEIVFMSYHDEPDREGVVRAVHGGGPNKGQDYFALCNTQHWLEGEPVLTDCNPADNSAESRSAANGRASGALAVGDLTGDGFPEIVVPLVSGALRILNNRGEILTTSAARLWPNLEAGENDWRYPAPAIANLDFEGLPEIIVGNRVLTLALDGDTLTIDRVFTGALRSGTTHHFDPDENDYDEGHHGPVVCVADLTQTHEGLEIVAGTTAYRLPDAVDCSISGNANTDYCRGTLEVVWDATEANPGDNFYKEGFCAVADVLGADTAEPPGPENPLDGVPEVLVLASGELVILDAETGERLVRRPLGGGPVGGAPNIDDFDGDGFPEVATALQDFYTVVDLQAPTGSCPAWNQTLGQNEPSPGGNPARDPGGACTQDSDCNTGAVCNVRAGNCVCLHSGWRRDTEDDSSRVSSSSVFDFNGDGAAEVVYNDECYFRIYDGATGAPYLAIPSLSRTIIENPVVADVDNDGNAEILFVQNNEELQCSEQNLDGWPNGNNDVARDSLPNGIEVWGDPSDAWVAARRVWNQHSYHVTNVTESGGIPLHEPESWRPLNGRLYNTYRSQPRNYGVAPDLALLAIQITSPNVTCGELTDEIQISVLVKNEGDLRVGPGVVLDFNGTFENPVEQGPLLDAGGDPITVTLDKSLEPGASTLVTVSYEAGNGGREDLPVEIGVIIDRVDRERECREDNNDISATVEAGEELADLRVVIESATCQPARTRVTVHNDGVLPAESFLVRVYAGDPSQGGQVIAEETVAGPLEPGESETLTIAFDPVNRDVTLYVVADPQNSIAECNDANNTANVELDCGVVPR